MRTSGFRDFDCRLWVDYFLLFRAVVGQEQPVEVASTLATRGRVSPRSMVVVRQLIAACTASNPRQFEPFDAATELAAP